MERVCETSILFFCLKSPKMVAHQIQMICPFFSRKSQMPIQQWRRFFSLGTRGESHLSAAKAEQCEKNPPQTLNLFPNWYFSDKNISAVDVLMLHVRYSFLLSFLSKHPIPYFRVLRSKGFLLVLVKKVQHFSKQRTSLLAPSGLS